MAEGEEVVLKREDVPGAAAEPDLRGQLAQTPEHVKRTGFYRVFLSFSLARSLPFHASAEGFF